MDLTVYPKTRIARLPRPLQRPAALARNLIRRPKYVYKSDGLATIHLSPFMEDREFDEIYWRVEKDWLPNWHADLRWRVWMLTRLARRSGRLAGNFAEFGVFRGGTAYMTLATTELAPERRFYLFDTFSGTPTEGLTETEADEGLGSGDWQYADTSSAYVAKLLDRWRGQIEIREGDVSETLAGTETGPLSFVHLDLNASAPTLVALQYVYPRLLEGAVIVFDDYGDPKYRDQRATIEAFFSDKPEEAIALPTGQAFLIRTPA
jgi:O-methyltransferase